MDVKHFLRPEYKAPAVVGAISFAAGVGVGWLVHKRKTDNEDISQLLSEEFQNYAERVQEETAVKVILPKPEPLQEGARVIHPPVAARQTEAEIRAERDIRRDMGEEAAKTFSAFSQALKREEVVPKPEDDNWDQKEEEQGRSPNAPYVIHRDEWNANPLGYNQQTLEFFEGDKILCDENRIPIYAYEKAVGRLEFGRGSGEPDTVYVRNDEHKAEYEIIRRHTTYQAEVMGLHAEEAADEQDLRHSREVRKFRMD